jgi:DNA polymerase
MKMSEGEETERKFHRAEALRQEYTNCKRCKLSNPCGRQRSNVVFGEGNLNAQVLIVGEAPGDAEDKEGVPFCGKSGSLIERLLTEFNIERDELYITNTVLCRPTDPKNFKKNRTPEADELKACRERLHKIIEIIDPHTIILLGDIAYKELTGSKTAISKVVNKGELLMAKTKGKFLPVERPAVVTFHPAYLLRNMSMETGGAVHKTLIAMQKAFRVSDTIQNIYWGTPMPDRGAPFEE